MISANAAEPVLVDQALIDSGKIDIRPEYPAQAQLRAWTGAGVFILHVSQPNGRVVSVDVQKSTGHKILDDAAIAKFASLQFKPHTVSTVTIPVEFTSPLLLRRALPAAAFIGTAGPRLSGRPSKGGGK